MRFHFHAVIIQKEMLGNRELTKSAYTYTRRFYTESVLTKFRSRSPYQSYQRFQASASYLSQTVHGLTLAGMNEQLV